MMDEGDSDYEDDARTPVDKGKGRETEFLDDYDPLVGCTAYRRARVLYHKIEAKTSCQGQPFPYFLMLLHSALADVIALPSLLINTIGNRNNTSAKSPTTLYGMLGHNPHSLASHPHARPLSRRSRAYRPTHTNMPKRSAPPSSPPRPRPRPRNPPPPRPPLTMTRRSPRRTG
jgi:hypothetical protein